MKCAIAAAATGVMLDPRCCISCTHVLGSVGSHDTGQQLGLAAFAIISADAQSVEPGPGDIILHCENSFVSTPAYLHWAQQ